MQLIDIVQRQPNPAPWSEGEKIPWNEPAFSRRMLREHLSQDHDHASRRAETIDRQVAWIHEQVLGGQPSQVLDLGCGPGLYSLRLSRLGHRCRGIDFSPASVEYARQQAQAENADVTYVEADVRAADYGPDASYDMVMLIYGEFNVFRREDAEGILRKAYAALKPGGRLLLEPHTFEAVRQIGEASPSWYTSKSGLFSDEPYLMLQENFWDAETALATQRLYAVDAGSGEVTRYADSMQAYTEADYRQLIEAQGLEGTTFYPSLAGEQGPMQEGLLAVVAQKPDGRG